MTDEDLRSRSARAGDPIEQLAPADRLESDVDENSLNGSGPSRRATFASWYELTEPRLRAALASRYGPERGAEATAGAMAWAWEHWERVEPMLNSVGYLYRVGQSRARRRRSGLLPAPDVAVPQVEPGLQTALSKLSRRQRSVVLLVHGHGWTLSEVADVVDITKSSVQTYLDRGMAKLRDHLRVDDD